MKQLLVIILFFVCNFSIALAKNCNLEITGNDQMQFDKKELKVSSSCKKITLKLTHTGKMPKQVMGHNWVLLATPDLMPVAQAAMTVGIEKDFIPADKSKIIAYTKVIGGGESTSVTFDLSKLKKGGDYSFVCTFAGHYAMMKGKFIVE